MKGSILIIAALFVLPYELQAQDRRTPAHQHTEPPINARFEIIQFPDSDRPTLRLDRFSGQISLLVVTEGTEIVWEDMEIMSPPYVPTATTSRFQIFMPGAGPTLLLDAETGKTWRMVTERRGPSGRTESRLLWQPNSE